jgi:hypothetical protein
VEVEDALASGTTGERRNAAAENDVLDYPNVALRFRERGWKAVDLVIP